MVEALGADVVAELEKGLEQKAAAAEDLECKEGEEETEEVQASPPDEKEAETDPQITREEIADAMLEAVKPLYERLDAMEGQIDQVKQADDEKIKERMSGIPAASLTDMVRQSVIGQEATKVDGRKSLAKDGPEETPHPEHTLSNPGQGMRGPSLIHALASGKDWRDAMPKSQAEQA
jgi:hypothetical protein